MLIRLPTGMKKPPIPFRALEKVRIRPRPILYYTILYYTTLYYTILYYTIL